MNIPFVDLKAQYLSIKDEVKVAMDFVLENTMFIGGKPVDDFKNGFEKLYGVKHCIPCANGTDALFISMKMLGITTGDEVITTASSWISTSETITQAGAKPVFVDIDEFYTIDVSAIEAAITPRTKAIMADMPSIMKIAEKHKLHVIEDCAQSHFSSIDNKRAGLWGDIATFSFYPGKNLGAYGDAGCIITSNDELAEKCTMYAKHGALKKHHHIIEGINSRLDTLQAAVLNVKLKYIIDWTASRKRIGELYLNGLKDIPDLVLPKMRDKGEHTFHVFAIRVKQRDELRAFLKENGINCQIHYPKAMPFMPAYDYLNLNKADFKKAKEHQEEELSLPIYPEMTDEQVYYVIKQVKAYFNESI
jgi:dTDP-4-amino-4,6-dideoxygalactose transaminase